MANQNLVRLERELRTTEILQEDDFADWDLLPQEKLDPEHRRWPYFTKRVMKGSMHHTAQSVICVPTPFMREHPETFQAGNLITLEGPSGNTWRVRATDKPIIHSGWRAFAHDHDLKEGDSLCFNLTRPSHFVVDVLDGNGEVKGTAFSATNTGKYTVSSINNPCEYVRRSRKRKNSMSPPTMKKTPRRSRDGFGYGVHGPTIASRCKTTARRRSSSNYPLGVRLRFSDKTKQWECHEEMDGREVVTILDSDDEAAADDNRLLDHIGVSFGSAQVQNYRRSKIQRLMEYMTTPSEYVPQWWNPRPQQVVATANEDQRMVAKAADQLDRINHQEVAGHGGGKVFSELIVYKEAKMVVTAQHQMNEATIEKFDSGNDLLPCQAQGSCIKDMTMNKEGAETYHKLNVETGNKLETIRDADSVAFQSHKIPTPLQEGTGGEHEPHVTLGLCTMRTDLPVNPSQGLSLTYTAAMSDKAQFDAGGEFLFATLQNIVDMPVIADTTNGVQNRDGVHPLMRDLIIQERAQKNLNIEMEAELHPNESQGSEREDSVLQSSASKVHKPGSEISFTNIQSAFGYGNNASQNTEEDESTKQQYLHFLQPPKATVDHPRRQLEFKQFLNNIIADSDIRNLPKTPYAHEKGIIQAARNPPLLLSVKDHTFTETCVLKSRRGSVAKLDREKTLKAALAWTKKLRNPNFIAVMQTSNVYHDFIMDIPGEFAKKSRLPATETKAMLICDEVPTMCKAVWEGAKLNARGWMEFSRSHYLEEGDVCVLELHNRAAVRIGVHIFRVVGLRRSLVDWTQHYNVIHLGTHENQVPLSNSNVEPGSTRAAALEVL